MTTELETNNKNSYNKSDENQIIQSENISVEGGCLPSLLIYNENLAYQQQTVNSNNESTTASINFNQSNNNSIMTVKKAKNETKKP